MQIQKLKQHHVVPEEYHGILHIGDLDQRGNVIDFKVPPIIVNSANSIRTYEEAVLKEHIDAGSLPMVYVDARPFVILRPSALLYKVFVREQLEESGMVISEEFELLNFMRFADSIYELDRKKSFHINWRIIVKVLHETGMQNQNKAFVFILKAETSEKNSVAEKCIVIKNKIRLGIGDVPVVIKYNGVAEIALGIHHLHSPNASRIPVEYNALMHAKYGYLF